MSKSKKRVYSLACDSGNSHLRESLKRLISSWVRLYSAEVISCWSPSIPAFFSVNCCFLICLTRSARFSFSRGIGSGLKQELIIATLSRCYVVLDCVSQHEVHRKCPHGHTQVSEHEVTLSKRSVPTFCFSHCPLISGNQLIGCVSHSLSPVSVCFLSRVLSQGCCL